MSSATARGKRAAEAEPDSESAAKRLATDGVADEGGAAAAAAAAAVPTTEGEPSEGEVDSRLLDCCGDMQVSRPPPSLLPPLAPLAHDPSVDLSVSMDHRGVVWQWCGTQRCVTGVNVLHPTIVMRDVM
jgi:hypothetical protein